MSHPSQPTVPLQFQLLPPVEMEARARAFAALMRGRRSVRQFAADAVPRPLIELAIAAAHSAPSGANRQPWHFVAVSDPAVKASIRRGAEEVEREFYEGGRATDEWLHALTPLGTSWHKPYLEAAPWLVVVFKQVSCVGPDGEPIPNYYVNESVGIACGLFIAALHHMGLVTLTHTPQPMRFLSAILGRPANERPYILFPVGYPAPGCSVPDITKKPLEDVVTWFEDS
jgi:iodotyrosine deiodinase